MLSRAHGIEELFLLSSRPHGNVPAADGTPDSLDSPCSKSTPGSDHASASRDAASREPFNFKHKKPISGLARAYIDMIISKHGPSLKRLLLPDQWLLPSEELARLVRGCPNLEQLGLAMDETTLEVLGLLLPFLPKLIAIRILDPSPTQSRFRSIIEVLADPAKIQEMGCDFQRMDYHSLRWIGIGDRVMHISGPVPHSAPVAVSFDALPAEAQPQLSLPVLRWVGREAVQHVEIWSMDRLEL
ncbi:MAG: hypothetical protein M1838_004840 [Thelocarpon superellum]|nr:MAG: hypothetical protein M1838_004840 [Thelocarpon superellum]